MMMIQLVSRVAQVALSNCIEHGQNCGGEDCAEHYAD
ncbi:hypothetical protein BH11CYA1_BH11CYA1_20980 [soil metagenome]